MYVLSFIVGVLLILLVLLDTFETIVLPRRVNNPLRLTALFYRTGWALWSAPARRRPAGPKRETYLAFFGPLSLLVLLAVWSLGLMFGFALVYRSFPFALHSAIEPMTFWTDLYASGTTLFTLGLGDVTPTDGPGRVLMIVEVGMGFAFLALVIGYLPILYQSFSRREANISLLDARAGSPPSASELLNRCGGEDRCEATTDFLSTWERWSAELLETHLSYPVLGYYRSQHENQSWLAAMTTILDISALAMVGIDGVSRRQGRLTFAIARHTIVDLAQVFRTPPVTDLPDRLTPAEFDQLTGYLRPAGLALQSEDDALPRLNELRKLYEPYVAALSEYFLMPIPDWFPVDHRQDNWQSTAWGELQRH
jgi:hypothetical protein